MNFETVKYFTAEAYEKQRFGEAVGEYQFGSVDMQASLSFLNVSQQVLLQACMATALSLTVLAIQQRIQCCTDTVGCESGLSDCCRNVDAEVCGSMSKAVALAMQEAEAGDTVLLAPAAASFDQYDNFEQRGDDFATEVKNRLA